LLLVTFLAQFGFPSSSVRYGFSAFYIAAGLAIAARQKESRDGLWAAIRAALTPPWRGARR